MEKTRDSGGLLAWIESHDERLLFVVSYITLAVVLTIWLGLFWLVVVVGVHALFELIRQSVRHHRPGRVLLEAAWEVKLDIALVIFALALALYIDVVMGILGLQQAARAGAASARAGGRFLVWQRVLRAIALSVDDVFNAGRFVRPMLRMRQRPAPAEAPGAEPGDAPQSEDSSAAPAVAPSEEAGESAAPEDPARSSWRKPWGWGDHLAVGLGVACLLLILLSPLLTQHTPLGAVQTLAAELKPFPG